MIFQQSQNLPPKMIHKLHPVAKITKHLFKNYKNNTIRGAIGEKMIFWGKCLLIVKIERNFWVIPP